MGRVCGAGVLALAFASALISACGDDTAATDTGADALDSGTAPDAMMTPDAAGPSPIAPPQAPRFTPCPDGWREVADGGGGFPVCEPFSAEDPEECGAFEAHFPGRPSCEAITTPCPADGWPTDIPSAGEVIYVRAGEIGGDGSRLAPYGAVDDAVAAASDGAFIAMSVGEHVLSAGIVRPMTFRGACAETTITGTFFGMRIRTMGVHVENLRMTGAAIGVRVESTASAIIRDVVFEDNLMIAINVEDSTADVEHVLLAGAADTGITCARGEVSARLVEIRDVGGVGIDTRECTATLADSTVRGVGGRAFPQLVNADRVSATTLRRVVFVDNTASEIAAINDASLTVEDVVVRQPPIGRGSEPFAMLVSEGTLDLTRVRIHRGRRVALGAAFPRTILRGRDVWITETVPGPVSIVGYGLEVSEGATAELERIRVEGSSAIGALVSGAGSTLALTDAVIADTGPDARGAFGRAFQIQLSSEVTASRVAAERSVEGGIVVTGALATIEDVSVDTVVGGGADATGPAIGVGAYLSAAVDIRRFAVRRADLAGLQVASESGLDLFDGEVSNNPIGVNVQVDGYDLSRLMERVFYRDNGVNLDADVLPVPEPTVGVGR